MAAMGARADSTTTYTYGSQVYSTTSIFAPCPGAIVCQTTGSLTFASALPDNMPLQEVTPESYSFTDGATVLDNTNSSIELAGLQVATNASGQIVAWYYFFIQGIPGQQLFEMCGSSSITDCGLAERTTGNYYYDQIFFYIGNSFQEYAYAASGPGTWVGGGTTQTGGGGGGLSPTPEPGGFALLLTGVIGLLAMQFRKRFLRGSDRAA
jgi:hypothetical protein